MGKMLYQAWSSFAFPLPFPSFLFKVDSPGAEKGSTFVSFETQMNVELK